MKKMEALKKRMEKFIFISSAPIVIGIMSCLANILCYFAWGVENMLLVNVTFAIGIIALIWGVLALGCVVALRFLPDEDDDAPQVVFQEVE